MSIRSIIIFLSVLTLNGCARADSPIAASLKVVASPDGSAIVRVIPAPTEVEQGRSKAIVMIYDHATMCYRMIAEFSLRNPEAPIDVVISNNARYIVTFDDWGKQGRTANAVVLYDGRGNCLKAWSLEDIFTQIERSSFVESVSSTHWRDDITLYENPMCGPIIRINPYSEKLRIDGVSTAVGARLHIDFNLEKRIFIKK